MAAPRALKIQSPSQLAGGSNRAQRPPGSSGSHSLGVGRSQLGRSRETAWGSQSCSTWGWGGSGSWAEEGTGLQGTFLGSEWLHMDIQSCIHMHGYIRLHLDTHAYTNCEPHVHLSVARLLGTLWVPFVYLPTALLSILTPQC